ncbi:hypothetical protein KP003_10830 [Geomonas nitrogeniifigens]|uniref:Uncharacterized protein n=1 Tax=Geomonas diazotrophica TaxID=2843197 RepID=A0ABX8JDZ1_9BACT|nr:CxxxxCH/CxxCH domain-containing protein [Geomonas nitrogeniifigens]QWV95819.1 hypothetical protein KP005_10470 [Geomonas nitrogeniifigens]QXE84902.1 hypothetical protein KP003_10830 [Geomonas nitrogeniifigens]
MNRLLTVIFNLALLTLVLLSTVASGANTYCYDSKNNQLCPDSIHLKHQNYMNDCTACHNLNFSFDASKSFFKDSTKGAFYPGGPYPIFAQSGSWSSPKTNTAATCSNIACHNIPAGTYIYYIYDWGADDYVAVNYNYGGMSNATALWQDQADTNCNSCHKIPPYSKNVWHSGQHTNNTIPGGNNCELCHPDAKSNIGPDGKTIISNYLTAPSQHKNGTLDVVAKFTSKCFGCH